MCIAPSKDSYRIRQSRVGAAPFFPMLSLYVVITKPSWNFPFRIKKKKKQCEYCIAQHAAQSLSLQDKGETEEACFRQQMPAENLASWERNTYLSKKCAAFIELLVKSYWVIIKIWLLEPNAPHIDTSHLFIACLGKRERRKWLYQSQVSLLEAQTPQTLSDILRGKQTWLEVLPDSFNSRFYSNTAGKSLKSA